MSAHFIFFFGNLLIIIFSLDLKTLDGLVAPEVMQRKWDLNVEVVPSKL